MTSPPTSLGKLRTSDENSHSFLPSSFSFLWIITQTFLLPSHLGRNVPCHMDRLTPSPASHHAGLLFRDQGLSFFSAGDLSSATTWAQIFSFKDKQTHSHQQHPSSATLHVSLSFSTIPFIVSVSSLNALDKANHCQIPNSSLNADCTMSMGNVFLGLLHLVSSPLLLHKIHFRGQILWCTPIVPGG